jgi:hypothetical protein
MSPSPHDPATAAPKAKRPANTRFTLGNKGGPGNPFARQVAEIRKLLLNAVPGERLTKIVMAMVEKAEAGDVAAAKLVLQYTAGKPAETVNPDRIELDDHRIRVESSIPSGGWCPPFGELPVQSVNSMWDTLVPQMEEETLLPLLLGGLEVEAAPPGKKAEAERKTSRRAMRILETGIPPSPNGSIGRELEKLRRQFRNEPERPAKPSKSARAG